MNQGYSDSERVHAFVDGQLDAAEKRRFLQELASDTVLQEQVCRLRRLKEYVAHAYEIEELPPVRARCRHPWSDALRSGVAAMLLLSLGFTLGWYTHERDVQRKPESTSQTAGFDGDSLERALAKANEKVIIHVAQDSPDKFRQVLDQAEHLLQTYSGRNIQVEVIANAGGLDLVRQGTSPYAERIREMMMRYNNLHFFACATAMRKLESRGIHAVLLRNTLVAPSAVQHIIERVQEGWVYIKV